MAVRVFDRPRRSLSAVRGCSLDRSGLNSAALARLGRERLDAIVTAFQAKHGDWQAQPRYGSISSPRPARELGQSRPDMRVRIAGVL